MTRRVPVFVWVGSAVTALLTAGLLAAGWWLAYDQRREDRILCERTVQVRYDNRAMWIWLIDAVAGTSDLADPARIELDKRIPALRCVDDHPEPLDGVGDD